MAHRHVVVGGLLLAGTLLAVRPANAANIGFELTEVNSTTLTSSLAGLTITNTAADTWTITTSPIFTVVPAGGGSNMAWVEPDNPNTVNYLHLIPGTTTLQLQSDFPLANLPAGLVCGSTPAPLASGVTCNVGSNSDNVYFVGVIDQADAAAVPEPASMLLLGTGLVGMGARRWRNRRQRA